MLTPGAEIQNLGIKPDLEVELTEAEKAYFPRNLQFIATQDDLMWTEALCTLQL